jgi:hypothetical protein
MQKMAYGSSAWEASFSFPSYSKMLLPTQGANPSR